MLLMQAEGGWLQFDAPLAVHIAWQPDDVARVMTALDIARKQGLHIAGFLAYEAAGGLDPALVTHKADGKSPLAWFGVYADVTRLAALPEPAHASVMGKDPWLDWQPEIERDAYARAIAQIRDWIRAGDTYQVNYTFRLRSPFDGDPYALFCRLCEAQTPRYAVYGDLGDWVVCSVSPELFFAQSGEELTMRPMKGTSSRGLTEEEDACIADALAGSSKNLAENVMIVDMIRNDLGRIAEAGSVVPHPLFEIERYPTLFQMVSTVKASSTAGLDEIFRALFPCASITGAPKVRTMQIIRTLETSLRRFYTGTAGYALADGRSQFNVMIRTVLIDKGAGRAEYGTGGGIVWDSDVQQEYAECLVKARILTHVPPDFALLETLCYEPDHGFLYYPEHVERAGASARYWGYSFDRDEMLHVLQRAVEGKRCMQRVRWLLAKDGAMRVTSEDLVPLAEKPVRVAKLGSCRRDNVFLYHKTTRREVYTEALAANPDCRDVILVNEVGEVTESCFANIVYAWEGRLYTPPVACGLLNGAMRRRLIRDGKVHERPLLRDDVCKCEKVWLINSVRGWYRVDPSGLDLK